MAWLRVIEGKMKGLTYLLDENPRTAGREPDNRIHLEDGKASRRHARFEWALTHHRVCDLESKNGTSVNGKPFSVPHPLVDQDRIKIGSHLLVYEQRGRPGYRDSGLAATGWLKVISGRKLGATYQLGDRICTAGRDPGNLIQLIDDDTSRRHAQFKWTGEHYELVDLDSTNGTKVNGLPCAEHRLVDGDRVEIGGHVLLYEAKGSMRYRDEGLAGKNIAPRLTSDSTNIVYNPIELQLVEMGSIEIDIEVVEDASSDASFEIELDLDQVPKPAPKPRPGRQSTEVDPELRAKRTRERIGSHLRTSTAIPSFLEAVINEAARFIESDRLIFLFFSGATLTPRATRTKGRASSHETPPEFLHAAIRHVVRHKKAVRNNDILARRTEDPSELYDAVGTVVCAPILTVQLDYGVVYADNLGPAADPFSDVEFGFIRELATDIATGVTYRGQRRAR